MLIRGLCLRGAGVGAGTTATRRYLPFDLAVFELAHVAEGSVRVHPGPLHACGWAAACRFSDRAGELEGTGGGGGGFDRPGSRRSFR